LESLVEKEEKETSNGPTDTNGLPVVSIDAPLDTADLHLLVLNQHLTHGNFRLVNL
jgi:hypothetical protein